ncbi:hypothetical protein PAXRUDRAFT_828830 [Paxillus rubicundulus Ve08.2h10]|uniref:Unplaced genomic scaffold scaffold_351, whole genome shotgun sequence n=1 Tax=Paxillus rubicundulus Ve08.2h10 TaxID=930991 RepID=A0A0D0D999_9AGAM|nr:hypothetical protein PAXRUDRAFT_828830 [Paxillus rubicundulus Ve08.2h10]
MADNPGPPDQQQSFLAATLVPRLVRSLSKAQSTTDTQQITSTASAEQATSSASTRWISKQKATAIGHFTKFTHKLGESSSALDFPPTSWFGDVTGFSGTNLAQASSQGASAGHTPAEVPVNSVDATTNDPAVVDGESPEPTTLAKKIRDVISTIPSLPSTISTSSSRLWISPSSIPPEVGTDGPPAPASVTHDLNLLALLTSSDVMNGSFERGRQSVWSALDHLRPPYSKKRENATSPEAPQDAVLDCLDDNNSVMMYGPLEPDDSSEVEIACSEIVSVNGDGEEIRTPQPRFVPLPSESIDRVLMRGGGDFTAGNGMHREVEPSEVAFVGMEQMWASAEPARDQPPVKEYRVWLPSLTKISVQTMWWGFRIYLPPPVLDILNNKQLEAAKRAAIITTALKWLMDHLPIPLLPPQMRPAVAVLRRLVPYLGYMGGLIAWSWTAIRSFDKGYGVVLTATWLLPVALIPGTWEVDEFPTLHTDPQPPTSTPY